MELVFGFLSNLFNIYCTREVWPEEGIFGVEGIPEDEELDMLETVYNTDLGVEVIGKKLHSNIEKSKKRIFFDIYLKETESIVVTKV